MKYLYTIILTLGLIGINTYANTTYARTAAQVIKKQLNRVERKVDSVREQQAEGSYAGAFWFLGFGFLLMAGVNAYLFWLHKKALEDNGVVSAFPETNVKQASLANPYASRLQEHSLSAQNSEIHHLLQKLTYLDAKLSGLTSKVENLYEAQNLNERETSAFRFAPSEAYEASQMHGGEQVHAEEISQQQQQLQFMPFIPTSMKKAAG